ncbi:hypothetical protein BD289DRAFT_436336 [Coniella lustricola]|uniref:DUF7924 domain-containing protein n=1 Tax=Coniella lustricola TaxID=2025994 RepID=A0A2T3A5E5_9PEZI|nr:hypothetical protein BD289DRAFT_436336 [Coniella lustricola]
MTLAVRGVVELFPLVKRENEVDRQILAFSISHDHCSVRIYGYYPVVGAKDTKYYRHPIHKFDFTALDGQDKWASYRFTKNVYHAWMPAHFKKICSAIDQLPLNVDFGVATPSESIGPLQDLENAEADFVSPLVDKDGQTDGASQTTTPVTTFSKPGPAAKRMKSPVNKV